MDPELLIPILGTVGIDIEAFELPEFGGCPEPNRIASFAGISQLEAAGIDRHITPHMLRHTVATLLLRNGMDIRVVQEFLGHASIATTQRYTHIVKEHLIGELRKRHPSLSLRVPA
jgi:integrase